MKLIEKKDEDDSVSFGDSYAYCTYHQRRGNYTNKCKSLEATILDLIAQGKYEIKENALDIDQAVNTISVDKEICVLNYV